MGTQNMIFLTFGTGFGAGLILGADYMEEAAAWQVKSDMSAQNRQDLWAMGRKEVMRDSAAAAE